LGTSIISSFQFRRLLLLLLDHLLDFNLYGRTATDLNGNVTPVVASVASAARLLLLAAS
jgi:hypothetical protein